MALNVPSGIVVQASGFTPTGRTMYLEPLPVVIMGASGDVVISHYSGALNVNISGGTISSNVSGNYVNISASGVGISHYSGALNVNISGGTISVSPFGLQSGTMVLVSGGQGAISGVAVEISGQYTNLASSGVGISHFSGALNVNISGGTISVSPFGFQSGTEVVISGGSVGISGTAVTLSGIFSLSNVSGGVAVSGAIQVSGTVAVSGQVIVTSGGTIPVGVISGAMNISGGVTVSGGVSVSGGVQVSGTVAVSGVVMVQSGVVSMFEWPSYSLAANWSGPVGIGIMGLAHAGGAAGNSGMVIELMRLEMGIWSSGNINRVDMYRVNDSTIAMSGPAGNITAFYSGNAVSLASGFVTSGGLVSGAWSGVVATETILLEANSSGFMHNYIYEFNQFRGQSLQVTSGQGVIIIMTSGIGIGTASLYWVERYLS